jgi:oxygen-dependent protoporphyrinogen oxidase
MTSVLVVGAGIAGLTAGYRLREAGFDVTVVEAAASPGGRMADLRDGDIAYNSGARLIYPFGRALWALLRDLGLDAALVPIRDLSAACRIDGVEYALDLMPTLRSLRTPGLTGADRLRLVGFALRLAWLRHRVDPDDLASLADTRGESLAGFADRVLGRRVRQRLIDPLFRGTRSWNPEDIAPAFLLTTLPHMLNRRTVYVLAGGMGRLTRDLSARLGARCGARVTAIARPADGPCRSSLADGGTIVSDLVILAVEGARAAALLAAPEPEETSFFAALRYNSLGVVHYALDADVAPAMRFIDRGEGLSIATYQQLPAAPRAGRPRAQIYCQLTPEATLAARQGGRALEPMVRDDVRRFFPDLDRRACAYTEQWIEHKLPVPYPGFAAHMARFRRWQAAAPRRVYFCGDYLAQALVTGACASGAAAARVAAGHWPATHAHARRIGAPRELQPC